MQTGAARVRRRGLVVLCACTLVGCTSTGSAPPDVQRLAATATTTPTPAPAPAPATAPTSPAPTSAAPAPPPTTAPTTPPPRPTTTTALPAPIRLLFTGDVLMHSPLWDRAVRNGGGTPDFVPMFAGIEPLVAAADWAVCHLETPIAPPGESWSTSPRYGVPAEVVDGLAAAGFDHCSTASNHTFDRGVGGVEATIDRFAHAGLTQHGMASAPPEIEPIVLDVGGVRIGHVSATYGYDGANPPADEPWRSNRIDLDRLLADAALARERGAQVVVLSLHWGSSNSHRVNDEQRRIADALAASGLVDLVVGHHAHVVQPVEQIGATWVAFGLGNLISNMPLPSGPFTADDTRDGLVLQVELSPAPDGSVAIARVVARPVWVDRDAGWVVRDVAAALADDALVARVGPELRASWERTSVFVPWLVPELLGPAGDPSTG